MSTAIEPQQMDLKSVAFDAWKQDQAFGKFDVPANKREDPELRFAKNMDMSVDEAAKAGRMYSLYNIAHNVMNDKVGSGSKVETEITDPVEQEQFIGMMEDLKEAGYFTKTKGKLGRLGTAIKRGAEQTVRSTISTPLIMAGVESFQEGMDFTSDVIQKRAELNPQQGDPWSLPMEGAQGIVEKGVLGAGKAIAELGRGADMFAEQVPMIVGGAGVEYVTRGRGTIFYYAAQSFPDIERQLRDMGMNEQSSKAWAWPISMVIGGLDTVGARFIPGYKRLAGKFKGAATAGVVGYLKRFGIGMGKSVGGEVTTEVLQDLVEVGSLSGLAATSDELDYDPGDIGERVTTTAYETALSTIWMGLAGSAADASVPGPSMNDPRYAHASGVIWTNEYQEQAKALAGKESLSRNEAAKLEDTGLPAKSTESQRKAFLDGVKDAVSAADAATGLESVPDDVAAEVAQAERELEKAQQEPEPLPDPVSAPIPEPAPVRELQRTDLTGTPEETVSALDNMRGMVPSVEAPVEPEPAPPSKPPAVFVAEPGPDPDTFGVTGKRSFGMKKQKPVEPPKATKRVAKPQTVLPEQPAPGPTKKPFGKKKQAPVPPQASPVQQAQEAVGKQDAHVEPVSKPKKDIGKKKEALPTEKYSLYPITIKGKDYIAVRLHPEKQSGFGDVLFGTEEEAREYVVQEKKRAEQEEAYSIERKKAKDAEDAQKAKEQDIDGFADDKSPMVRGRAIKTLNAQVRHEGKITTVKQLVRDLVAKGEKPSTRETNKIQPMSRSRFNKATNGEQAAHEKKMLAAGKKTVYRVGGYDLGKTAHDYAQHLIDKAVSPEAPAQMPETKQALAEALAGERPPGGLDSNTLAMRGKWKEKIRKFLRMKKSDLQEIWIADQKEKVKSEDEQSSTRTLSQEIDTRVKQSGAGWRGELASIASEYGVSWAAMMDNTKGEEAYRLALKINSRKQRNTVSSSPEAPSKETAGETAYLRKNPPQVAQPTVIEPSVTLTTKQGRTLKGKGYAIPGAENVVVTVVRPHGSKVNHNKLGWSVWVGNEMVYANTPGVQDTAEQAISVATPKIKKFAAEQKAKAPSKETATSAKKDIAKPKTKLQEAADKASKEAMDSLSELSKEVKGKGLAFNPFLDPTVMAKTAKTVLAFAKAGTLQFAALMEFAAKAMGQKAADAMRPVFAHEWEKLRATGQIKGMDKADVQEAAAPPVTPSEPTEPAKPAEPPKTKEAPEGDGRLVSIKNAVVNMIREERGDAPFSPVEKKQWEDTVSEAEAKTRKDPEYSSKLIVELQQNGRAVNEVEMVSLLMHYVRATDAFDTAYNALQKAMKSGDPVSIANAESALAAASLAMNETERATNQVGTVAGRALNIRKMMMRRDYSFEALARKSQAAKGGKDLSKEEMQQHKEMAEKIKELQGKVETLEQENLAIAVLEAEVARLKADQKKPGKKKTAEPRKPTDKKAAAKAGVKAAIDNLKQKWQAVKQMGAVYDPKAEADKQIELTKALVGVVRAYAKLGFITLTEFLGNVKVEIGDSFPDIKGALENAYKQVFLKAEDGAINSNEAISRYAKKIVRALVESGITERETVFDLVHAEMSSVMGADWTRQQTISAIGGYGIYKPVSPLEVEKEIARLKEESLLLSQIADLERHMAPLATGLQRYEPGEEAQRLRKIVNDLKKQEGLIGVDSEKALKSALASAKTAAKNRILELENEIQTREKTIKEKRTLVPDEELSDLRKRRDELAAIHKEIFGKPKLTEEQVLKRLEKAVEALESDLAAGRLMPQKKAPGLSTAKTEAVRKRLEELRAERDRQRKENPEWMAMEDAQYEKRLQERLEALQKRIAEKDFDKKEIQPRRETAQTLELKYQIDQEKKKYEALREKYLREQWTGLQKAWAVPAELLNTSRSILTSMDVSAVLRQGGLITAAHPLMSAKAVPEMLRALASRRAEFEAAENICGRENHALYGQAGLELVESEGKLTHQEELYRGRWRELLGNDTIGTMLEPVAASERAYITFLNRLRADLFDLMVADLSRTGTATLAEAKIIANYVNVVTGRGSLGQYLNASNLLSTVFFAPRYAWSRFQFIVGQPLWGAGSWKDTARARKAVAKEYARVLMGYATFYGTVLLASALLYDDDDEDKPTVSFDWRSSDFMKVKSGNVRLDSFAGLSQAMVLIGRTLTGEIKYNTGNVSPLRKNMRFFGTVPKGAGPEGVDPTMASVAGNAVRSKTSPWLGNALDIAFGENVIGEETTVGSVATNLTIPLATREIISAMEDQGVAKGTALSIAALFGMGLQVYGYPKDVRWMDLPEVKKEIGKKAAASKKTVRFTDSERELNREDAKKGIPYAEMRGTKLFKWRQEQNKVNQDQAKKHLKLLQKRRKELVEKEKPAFGAKR